MKTEHEKDRDNALLDAVLGDESWTEVNAATKNAALAEFHARQRRRRIQFWAAQAAACALLAAGSAWWWQRQTEQAKSVASNNQLPAHSQNTLAQSKNAPAEPEAIVPATSAQPLADSPVSSPSQVASTASAVPASNPAANLPNYITEAQMLALFPKGSCTIAEINGQTQLIFFDHKIEEDGAPYQPGS